MKSGKKIKNKIFKQRQYICWLNIIFSFFLLFLVFHYVYMPKRLFDSPMSTILLDDKNELLCARIAKDEQWRFPMSEQVSQRFLTCLINYEDRRFYYHLGIDPIAVLRAIKSNLTSGMKKEGGSTLTMQLARMARGNQSRTIKNKIIESLWAIDIELTHSKEEILQLYASNAPFGGNIVGVDAAAWRYFNRDVQALSWAEYCTLAVLPNSPSLIHLWKNRNSLTQKRNRLLSILLKKKIITKEEYSLSILEPLPESAFKLPNDAPHLMDFLSQSKQEKRIKTKIDHGLQKRTQQLADDYNQRYRTSNHIDNIAILVLDGETGKPLSYVGNTTNREAEASQVDIIQSERSPGSTLKPFLYASMMSCGEITPKQLISDTPLNINGFTPSNFSRTFNGVVHADEAIVQSLNVPLVRMLSMHTTGRFMEDLKWLGMTTLRHNEDYYGASLILGGAEVKLWDLCRMYQKLSHQLLYENRTPKGARISRAATWFAFEAMAKLNRPEEEAEWIHFKTMKKIAWKTGTSWGNRDAWAIGITPQYVVGVWVGNATGEGRSGMTGVGFASPIMFDVFAMLKGGEWFLQPYDEMEEKNVCSNSGLLSSPVCLTTEKCYIPKTVTQTPICNYCQLVHLSKDEKWQVNTSCVSTTEMVTKPYFVLPVAQEYFYKKTHTNYHCLPPFRPDCVNPTTNGRQIDFIYPEHNGTVVIPRGKRGELEKIVCHAVSRKEGEMIFWHLDQQFIGKTEEPHKMAITPSIGIHYLSIVDNEGDKKTIKFEVK